MHSSTKTVLLVRFALIRTTATCTYHQVSLTHRTHFYSTTLPYPHTRQHILYIPEFYYTTVKENRNRTERIKVAIITPSTQNDTTSKTHFLLVTAKSASPCFKQHSRGRCETVLKVVSINRSGDFEAPHAKRACGENCTIWN